MPLKARLHNSLIYAWDYDPDEWEVLKEASRSKVLFMSCCDRHAIMRKSKLGTQHFAHARRGDCTTAPESAEHIYLKFLAAKAAKAAGWKVTTEHEGVTPAGHKWIADVYCEKGNFKVALEIQWSRQTKEEYRRRQERYAASGVRCAWLARLSSGRDYYASDLIYEHDTPVFYFCEDHDGTFYSPQFNINIADFLNHLMSQEVQWLPKVPDKVEVAYISSDVTCRSCGKKSRNIVNKVLSDPKGGLFVSQTCVGPQDAEKLMRDPVLQRHQGVEIGHIDWRICRDAMGEDKWRVGQCCLHCNALISEHDLKWVKLPAVPRPKPLSELYLTSNYAMVCQTDVPGANTPFAVMTQQNWTLNGVKANLSFAT